MKLGGKTMVLGGLVVAVLGAGALAYKRHLHKLAFIPEAPSRAMSHASVEPVPAEGPLRVLYVGHSLINEHMPAVTRQIAAGFGVEWSYQVQLTSGGYLQMNWNRAEFEKKGNEFIGPDARKALRDEHFDVFILTEAVPLEGVLRWLESIEYFERWYDLAAEHQGDDLRVYFYEGWHDRFAPRMVDVFPLPGSWQERARLDLDKWEHIVDARRAEREQKHPDGPPVHIIPGGQALMDLVAAVEAGEVPHVSSVDALFFDSIHLSALGNYYIALVQFATVARRSPVGAIHEVVDADGNPHRFEPETAERLQELAWQAVRTYPRQGFTARP